MTDHQTSPVGEDAERAAFVAWMKARPGYPFAGAYANLMWDAWQAARRAAPALDASGLPPLAKPKAKTIGGDFYTTEQVRQAQRDAVASRDAEIADLRAQLARTENNLAAATKEAWIRMTAQHRAEEQLAAARQVGKHLFDAVADGAAPTQPKAQVGSISNTGEFSELLSTVIAMNETGGSHYLRARAEFVAYIDAWAGSRAK